MNHNEKIIEEIHVIKRIFHFNSTNPLWVIKMIA